MSYGEAAHYLDIPTRVPTERNSEIALYGQDDRFQDKVNYTGVVKAVPVLLESHLISRS